MTGNRRTVLQRITALSAAALALATLTHTPARALDAPKDKVVLTMTGKVGDTNASGKAQFDLAMLQKLPQQTFTTQTPWDSKPLKFSGPLLRDVLAAAKGSGTQIVAVALNDYKITIPMEDAQQIGVIVAHQINDQPISVRTKGPLFIIYPFDSKAELKSAKYYERSIWQLKAIELQ